MTELVTPAVAAEQIPEGLHLERAPATVLVAHGVVEAVGAGAALLRAAATVSAEYVLHPIALLAVTVARRPLPQQRASAAAQAAKCGRHRGVHAPYRARERPHPRPRCCLVC